MRTLTVLGYDVIGNPVMQLDEHHQQTYFGKVGELVIHGRWDHLNIDEVQETALAMWEDYQKVFRNRIS